MKANSPNGLMKALTSDEVWCLELMKTFSVRLPQTYRTTVEEIIKSLRASPLIALVCMGAAGLLTAGLLMLLFVALLRYFRFLP